MLHNVKNVQSKTLKRKETKNKLESSAQRSVVTQCLILKVKVFLAPMSTTESGLPSLEKQKPHVETRTLTTLGLAKVTQ
jgi:hypothetical protein